jgi:hypothetical protein
MVEVFKTNVTDTSNAKKVKQHLKIFFPDYEASFDLEDCDRILRIQSSNGIVQSDKIIRLLNDFGFVAQVLPDNYPLPIIRALLNGSLCQ